VKIAVFLNGKHYKARNTTLDNIFMRLKDLMLFIPKEKNLYIFLSGMITMFIFLSVTIALTDSICIPNKEYKDLKEYYSASESLVRQIEKDQSDYVLDILSETESYATYERAKNRIENTFDR